MKITNIHDLPDALYQLILNDEYSKQGRFSASELPSPPQLRTLKLRHDAEIVKDASDFLFIIQGKSIHKLLERGKDADDLREESLMVDLGDGVTISGSTDLYTGDVVDWKVTSVFSFLLGGLKPEWEAQVNTYAWLWRMHGFETHRLFIYAILRDWQKSKIMERDYPKIPFMKIAVPKWDNVKVNHYIRNRVNMHLLAESLPDDKLPPCSLDDQWARPTTYAVMKKGAKRALRVFDNEYDANALSENTKGSAVVERLGKRVRCEDYCDAKPFCHQYKAEHPDKTAGDFGFETSEEE